MRLSAKILICLYLQLKSDSVSSSNVVVKETHAVYRLSNKNIRHNAPHLFVNMLYTFSRVLFLFRSFIFGQHFARRKKIQTWKCSSSCSACRDNRFSSVFFYTIFTVKCKECTVLVRYKTADITRAPMKCLG